MQYTQKHSIHPGHAASYARQPSTASWPPPTTAVAQHRAQQQQQEEQPILERIEAAVTALTKVVETQGTRLETQGTELKERLAVIENKQSNDFPRRWNGFYSASDHPLRALKREAAGQGQGQEPPQGMFPATRADAEVITGPVGSLTTQVVATRAFCVALHLSAAAVCSVVEPHVPPTPTLTPIPTPSF